MYLQLPIYFQAIRGEDTLGSGLCYLPTALSFAIAVLVAGPATTLIGYYNHLLVLGSLLMAIGVGLMTTFTPSTPAGLWIGYQILYGTGCGLAFQQPYTAVQIVLSDAHVPTALVSLSFTQELGGIVALSLSQNVLVNRLIYHLSRSVPSLDIEDLLSRGVLGVVNQAPVGLRGDVISAFNSALVDVFCVALALTCLTVGISLVMERRSVKQEQEE